MNAETVQTVRFNGEDGYYVMQIVRDGWADYYIGHIDYCDLRFCFGIKEEHANESYAVVCFNDYLDLIDKSYELYIED